MCRQAAVANDVLNGALSDTQGKLEALGLPVAVHHTQCVGLGGRA